MIGRGVLRAFALIGAAFASLPTPAWSQASPSAGTYAVRYDLLRREVGTIAPDADGVAPWSFLATRKTYNTAGFLVQIESGALSAWHDETIAPANWTGFTVHSRVDRAYDAMGRVVREAVSGDNGVVTGVTELSYDLAGRLKCTAVRMNPDVWATALSDKCVPGTAHAVNGPDRITRTTYTVHGEVLKVERAVGTPYQQTHVAYTYSQNGKQLSVTDANGNRSELTYDGLDRQKRWIFPSKTAPGTAEPTDYEEYGYDASANRTSLRKRDGVTLTYTYDAANRLLQKTVPASVTGAAGYSVFYGYDNRGLPTYARFGSASGTGLTNVYSGFGEIATATTNMDGTARTLTLQHDSNGNRTAFVMTGSTGGYHQTFVYDGLDRLKALQDYAGTTAAFSYDSAGRRSTVATGDPGSVTATTTYGYDSVGRLASLAHDLAGSTADQTIGFPLYNPASQILTRTASNPAYAWSDPNSYVRSYAANGLNQYTGATSTGAAPVTYGYDANGNLTSDGTTSFVYDAENRLVSASGAKTASLAYDPIGRLWQTSGGSGGTTRFLYDGDRRVIEYDGASVVLRSYVHGPGADAPITTYEVAGGTWHRRFLKADNQGSIIALNDDAGSVVALNAYDPWGIPKAGHAGRFGYTGQTWIPELGLWYYKARFYSPTLGRFLQTDPVGYKDQFNLYSYVGNDPVNAVDPLGTQTAQIGTCPEGQVVSASCRSGGGAPDTQIAQGGPLDQTKVDPNKLTPTTAPNFNSLVLFYGGYYINGPNGLTWHSTALQAAQDMGILTLTILGGEAIAPLSSVAGALGSRVVAGAGDHIVLGLRAFNLESTAAQVGGRTLLRDPAWKETLQLGLSNPSTRFTLSLDGLSGANVHAQVMGAAQRGVSGVGASATDWEIGMLWQNGRLGSAGLWQDGAYVANPF